ncbi:MAG: ABC transporter permease [Armatimonadota bacterium]
MLYVIAAFFIMHGIAHLPGFLVPWRLMTSPEMPYKTIQLGGRLNVGNTGIRLIGILWLLAALAFVASAVAVVMHVPWWRELTLVTTLFSLLLCVLGWPDSRIGLVVNIAILAFLAASGPLGWISLPAR